MKTKLLLLLPFLWLLTGCTDEGLDTETRARTQTDTSQTSEASLSEYHYELPVIFHIFYRSGTRQSISQARIAEIINACNKYYQNKLGSASVDMNLEFVLATEDEEGQTLENPGIDPVETDYPEQDCETFMADKANLKYLWDVDQYINIMLYPFKQDDASDGTILGISHLPYTVAPDTLAGLNRLNFLPTHSALTYPHCVSINSLFINSDAIDEEKGTYDSTDIIATTAHELGHYLGLLHIFSEAEDGSCEDTDYCDDTPSYDRDAYESWIQQNLTSNRLTIEAFNRFCERTNCAGVTSVPNNVMDYDLSWVNRFTDQQQERIRYVLIHSPFVPGPKTERTNTRSVSEPQTFPMRMVK